MIANMPQSIANQTFIYPQEMLKYANIRTRPVKKILRM